jgi:hypothetical protein
MTETDSRAANAGGDGRFQLLHRRLDAIISNQIRLKEESFPIKRSGAPVGGTSPCPIVSSCPPPSREHTRDKMVFGRLVPVLLTGAKAGNPT